MQNLHSPTEPSLWRKFSFLKHLHSFSPLLLFLGTSSWPENSEKAQKTQRITNSTLLKNNFASRFVAGSSQSKIIRVPSTKFDYSRLPIYTQDFCLLTLPQVGHDNFLFRFLGMSFLAIFCFQVSVIMLPLLSS